MALAQVPVERAAVGLVSCHIAVYPLMADRAVDTLTNPADLFGAPVCGQCHAHKVNGIRGETAFLTFPSSCNGLLMSLLRLIDLLIPITTQLTADGRWVNAELFGNASLRQAMVAYSGRS